MIEDFLPDKGLLPLMGSWLSFTKTISFFGDGCLKSRRGNLSIPFNSLEWGVWGSVIPFSGLNFPAKLSSLFFGFFSWSNSLFFDDCTLYLLYGNSVEDIVLSSRLFLFDVIGASVYLRFSEIGSNCFTPMYSVLWRWSANDVGWGDWYFLNWSAVKEVGLSNPSFDLQLIAVFVGSLPNKI